MSKILKAGLLSIAFCSLSLASAKAQTDDPGLEIFNRCSKELRGIVAECREANAHVVLRCLPEIEALLEEGERRAARELAALCLEKIDSIENRCSRKVRVLCRACIHELLELEEYELAHRFGVRCDSALNAIARDARRAAMAIREPFEQED